MKELARRMLPDVAAILCFVAITVAYFFTPVTEGLTLAGHDHTAGVGAGRERIEHNKTHDEPTYWTNALFGGMPTYQIAPSYPTSNVLFRVQSALGLWMPQLLTFVFLMLLGFYIMMRAFDFRVWMAALGAIVWAFSSYFFIIIGAGHLWKVYALAYLPPLIGGIVLCLRGRMAVGFIVTAVFAALEIFSNHPQMTYYFLPVIAVVTVCVAWQEYKTLGREPAEAGQGRGALRTVAARVAVAVAAGLIGVCINMTNLYHTYDYAKHTMRGKSELTSDRHVDAANQTKDGLDRDYITQWSYGLDETWSLLVPNINGGSSMVTLASDKTAMEKANPTYSPIYQSLRQYFGDQPFTAGPVYVGAIVLMLALLSIIVCRGPLRWGLLALTLVSIGLSWGHNWMWLTDLFLDYVPMYDKFRTVSSILVVAEFCIPLMAVLGLRELGRLRQDDQARATKALLIATGVTAGAAALIAMLPDLFVSRFVSRQELEMLMGAEAQGYIPQGWTGSIAANLAAMRRAVVSADAWRSAGFIMAAALALLVYAKGRCRTWHVLAVLTALCLADMWAVNKRYLNDGMFSRPRNVEASFAPSESDRFIMQDTALDYRVLNLAGDTFNENQTSYWHKSVGGYHAAKLRRYQELIEHYIRPQMNAVFTAVGQQAEDSLYRTYDVINMLNTRWFVLPLKDNKTLPVANAHAMGNAWFVSSVFSAANADEAMAALGQVDLRTTAVVEHGSLDPQSEPKTSESAGSTIALTDYQPNALTYETRGDGGLAVFSEIYYPGWRATLEDGTELPVVRANYVLRAAVIPAGQHTLTMRFDPQSIHVTEGVAWGAWALLCILGLLCITGFLRNNKTSKL